MKKESNFCITGKHHDRKPGSMWQHWRRQFWTQTARAAAQQHQVRQAAMKQRIPHRTAAPAMQAGSGDWVAAADEADDAVPGENDDRAFAKFDHVVEVHYGYQIDPKDTTLPDGDSVDNNQYTRYLLDNYNIKVVCDWTAGNASDFQQKVSLAIASASLPDAVVAPTRNYLVQAARADLLQTSGRSSTSTHPNR